MECFWIEVSNYQLEGTCMNLRDAVTKAIEVAQRWEALRPAKTFYGLTLEQFKAARKQSEDERAALADLRGQIQATKTRLHDADVRLAEVTQGVINAVKGDPQEGEDGEMYVALGYTRKSAKYRSRSRRRGNGQVQPAPLEETKPQEEVKAQTAVA
jgi:hypothetical protein